MPTHARRRRPRHGPEQSSGAPLSCFEPSDRIACRKTNKGVGRRNEHATVRGGLNIQRLVTAELDRNTHGYQGFLGKDHPRSSTLEPEFEA